MQLKPREKILAAVAGGGGLLLFAWLLLGGSGLSSGSLRAERDRLREEVQQKESRIAKARRASADLAEWKRRSLPADPANARSLYQAWLRELAERAGLRQPTVESTDGQPQKNGNTLFSFVVRGRAGWGPLTQFLYDFYSAGHLHKISRVDIKSVEGVSDLDVTMTVEALSLADADRKDRLSEVPGKGLKQPKLADYASVIVQRNLFAPPAPPPTPVAEKPAGIDRSKYIVVVAIVNADGRDEVFLSDRIADKLWKLGVGNSFAIGTIRGIVKTISPQDAVVQIDGRLCRLRVGEDLSAAIGPSPQRTQTEAIQDQAEGDPNANN